MANFNSTHTGSEIDDAVGVAKGAGTGLVAKTGTGAGAKRTITGTTSQVTVTNGDGVSGNPVIALDSAVTASLGLADTALQAGDIANFETSTELNARDTANRDRANHTGTQTANTISDFSTAAAAAAPVQTSDIANFETTAELNARDTANRDRANHTGTQTANTISDFDTAVDARVVPSGANNQVQFNDGGAFGGDAEFTYDKTTNELSLGGDFKLDDGATFETVVQAIPATANQVISFPDATGVVALVAGTDGQVIFNSNSAYSASSGLTFDSATSTLTVANTSVTGTLTAAAANVTGTFTASKSELTQATLSYAATTDIDFAAVTGTYQTVSLTGDVTFTTSNRAAGRSVVLRIICDGTDRNFTFPAGWKFLGVSAPASITANKTAVLSVTLFGTADSDAVCAYSVEP